jgi:hypothetical protein
MKVSIILVFFFTLPAIFGNDSPHTEKFPTIAEKRNFIDKISTLLFLMDDKEKEKINVCIENVKIWSSIFSKQNIKF